jgi:hypothetical protein
VRFAKRGLFSAASAAAIVVIALELARLLLSFRQTHSQNGRLQNNAALPFLVPPYSRLGATTATFLLGVRALSKVADRIAVLIDLEIQQRCEDQKMAKLIYSQTQNWDFLPIPRASPGMAPQSHRAMRRAGRRRKHSAEPALPHIITYNLFLSIIPARRQNLGKHGEG